MAIQSRYLVGDPIASVKMRNVAGQIVDYADQSLAGRALILFLAGGQETDRDWRAFADMVEALAALEVHCAIVAANPDRVPKQPSQVEVLVDAEGESAKAFGLTRPGVVLIGADSRIRAIESGYEFASIAERFQRAHDATRPALVHGQAPVSMIENVLERDLCTRLIEYWQAGSKRSDTVSSTKQGYSAQVAAMKRRSDVIVEDETMVALLRQRMSRRVLGEIRRVHHMDIVGHEAFRVGCYGAAEKGFFGRHRDNATPYTAHRRYALTLNLNDDFDGGELRFPEYGRMLYRPPVGGAVVFSCALLHEALPVIKGQRFVLLSFFFDREGARQEKERLASEREASSKS